MMFKRIENNVDRRLDNCLIYVKWACKATEQDFVLNNKDKLSNLWWAHSIIEFLMFVMEI